MRKKRQLWTAAMLGVVVLFVGSARGDDYLSAYDQERAKRSGMSPEAEKRISNLETDVKELKEAKEKPDDKNALLAYWDKGLVFKGKDVKIKFGGRVMWDLQWFSQHKDHKAEYGDLEDGTEFRRVRLYMSGDVYKDYFYKVQVDFAGGNVALKDAYLGMKNVPVIGHIKAGHFKEPFGLEELTNSKYITFIERSMPTEAFSPSRNAGIMIYNDALDKRLFWAVGLFRDVDGTGFRLADRGYAITARVAGTPWYAEKGKKLLHLGAAYSHRVEPDDAARYRARPECHLSSKRFVDTSTISSVDSVDLLGLEAAVVLGPFSLQGEYITAMVDGNSPDYDFSGWYAQASYWLTGEHRKYKGGAFSRVSPKKNFGFGEGSGWGAWEVAARYSQLDLNDGTIDGGKESNWTFGLNWHLNPNMRVMFNYINADTSAPDHGSADIFGVRFQVDF